MKLKDENIDNLELVKMPNVKKAKLIWIVRISDKNRYIVRVPKPKILIKSLKYKREKDYKREMLLPLGSKIVGYGKRSRSRRLKNNKYRKSMKIK